MDTTNPPQGECATKPRTVMTTTPPRPSDLVCFAISPGKAAIPADLDAFADLCAELSYGVLKLVHQHLPGAEVGMEMGNRATLIRASTEVLHRAEAIRKKSQMASDCSQHEPAACPPPLAGECAGQHAEARDTHPANLAR